MPPLQDITHRFLSPLPPSSPPQPLSVTDDDLLVHAHGSSSFFLPSSSSHPRTNIRTKRRTSARGGSTARGGVGGADGGDDDDRDDDDNKENERPGFDPYDDGDDEELDKVHQTAAPSPQTTAAAAAAAAPGPSHGRTQAHAHARAAPLLRTKHAIQNVTLPPSPPSPSDPFGIIATERRLKRKREYGGDRPPAPTLPPPSGTSLTSRGKAKAAEHEEKHLVNTTEWAAGTPIRVRRTRETLAEEQRKSMCDPSPTTLPRIRSHVRPSPLALHHTDASVTAIEQYEEQQRKKKRQRLSPSPFSPSPTAGALPLPVDDEAHNPFLDHDESDHDVPRPVVEPTTPTTKTPRPANPPSPLPVRRRASIIVGDQVEKGSIPSSPISARFVKGKERDKQEKKDGGKGVKRKRSAKGKGKEKEKELEEVGNETFSVLADDPDALASALRARLPRKRVRIKEVEREDEEDKCNNVGRNTKKRKGKTKAKEVDDDDDEEETLPVTRKSARLARRDEDTAGGKDNKMEKVEGKKGTATAVRSRTVGKTKGKENTGQGKPRSSKAVSKGARETKEGKAKEIEKDVMDAWERERTARRAYFKKVDSYELEKEDLYVI
ncbi:hypothetical protein AMATHDRAFT_8153 [Amanita thiersii Skay4041]|uniref:Uncharacterized protein n=1 Tax=Amanita thiersii Skay4041 TaxID=703135 RepID=A0A2A9NES5_9AGAR|nr:hypothetical protein AMATHDRAFT_8153 [Amanita thiersii Skay4041]